MGAGTVAPMADQSGHMVDEQYQIVEPHERVVVYDDDVQVMWQCPCGVSGWEDKSDE